MSSIFGETEIPFGGGASEVLRRLASGVLVHFAVILSLAIWGLIRTSAAPSRPAASKPPTVVQRNVVWLAKERGPEETKSHPEQTYPNLAGGYLMPGSVSPAKPVLSVRFADDPHQDLAIALRHYGGLLAFGEANVALYRFAPPDWQEVLPREPLSIIAGAYPVLIRAPRDGSFVGLVRSSINRSNSISLEAYALFPPEFQEVLEAEVLRAARQRCGVLKPSRGVVAFSDESPSFLKVIDVTCVNSGVQAQAKRQ